ncbi:MAG: DEAD/DEAH box helicase [Phycisphaeraceae bacterium]|nr:DEAD/DEAH box helicase [Phycisphaeraceae bacterium]
MVRDMELLEHHTRTAQAVLQRMRGRAMLCDEVGLGKTIEAGLILCELMMRGLVRRVLVLTPPSLIEQWQGEMRRKFSIELTTHDDPAFRESLRRSGAAAWGMHERLIASFHTAKRSPHREAILDQAWDVVIIDEAHHMRNSRTQLWKFASQLSKRFTLLLTATPVQNNLEELFNLVTLLEPGLLSTSKSFQRRFVDRRDKLTPRNVDELHELLAEVMVRNRRSTVGLEFTRRYARTEQLAPREDERRLYEYVTELVRRQLNQPERGLSRMALLSLQAQMGSSAEAAAPTLRKLAGHEELSAEVRAQLHGLADEAGRVNGNVKADRLLELLDELDDKLVVFTQFRGTQEMLQERLMGAGIEAAVFHGGLGRLEKERQIALFERQTRVLLTTDSGSEGRNLQFCNAICNFDLPWNPMRIEQRIGRLSRIGQARDVHVINLVAAGTVEAAILHLLEAKLAMFEMVIGEIDMVLGNLDEETDFADVVADLWGASSGLDDFAHRMEQLGDRLVAAKRAYAEQQAIDDRIFADRFRPEP